MFSKLSIKISLSSAKKWITNDLNYFLTNSIHDIFVLGM